MPEVEILSVDEGPLSADGFHLLRLTTRQGITLAHFYPAEGTRTACVWVGGIGGDWDSPAQNLYPRLARALTREGIASLRVRYRIPTHLEAAVHDVLAGIAWLEGRDIDHLALIGHSFGGAVVIQAAAREPTVRTVVALATQSHGADPAEDLGPRCSILLVHGEEDDVLPHTGSAYVYQLAREPKQLHVLPDAGHDLNEASDDVERLVRTWITGQLRAMP